MNYLTFESFISIPVLIVFYYIGALIFPLILWVKRNWVIKLTDALTQTFPITASRLILGFIILLLGFEIMWRMLFEMLIGYFQMREYLYHLAG
ncbi:MAG: DUF4282 domain-containing protein [Sulfuricurvum sp.]|uniref:DUF4282 domain-containing protein n=1 Tax=Sulfuricurvum sp. TaxID=2025608 RepID=UPI002614A6EF|nr:DUF4282 domain-containing protein [Sulfuricurvum sp.]MDD2829812.1 DUF4282 domain-containing protein [Sulfuricurvum sp.]MDD4950279.1 DUF4282 domain-containing protein [Sulfuricurvum sp.]